MLLPFALMLSLFITNSYADGGAMTPNPMAQFLPLILVFFIFYIFVIRPQQNKVKSHQKQLNELKIKDQVVTAGGILGKVTKLIDEATIEIQIAESVRIRVKRHTISEINSQK
jgi:preprotein translocase subunit YajC